MEHQAQATASEVIERAKASSGSDARGVRIEIVHHAHIDRAWADGAHMLAEACKWADREVKPDQLKMLLAENRRTLLSAVDRAGARVGWAAVQVQQLPNIRVLYVYSIYAPGITQPEVFGQLAEFARGQGCSSIRGACSEAVERLWARKFDARKLYSIVEIDL